MTADVRVRLVAVGDELLTGDQVNGNAVVLGQMLSVLGIRVVGHEVVGDAVSAIAEAIGRAAAHADAVVVCGGLGPTHDDLTREGLAAAADVELVRDEVVEAQLRERFALMRRGAAPANNWRQADVPRGAVVLANEVGTAPGLLSLVSGVPVYALPGVPREFIAMLSGVVGPDLVARFPELPSVVREIVHTVGLWESAVAEAMAPEIEREDGKRSIGLLAAGGQVDVVVTASGPDIASAQATLAPTVAYAKSVLGDAVFDGPTLEADVVRLLSAAGATVACAESLTAGLLTGRIANVAGASAVLRGGIIPYATDLKASLLEIPRLKLYAWHAVSKETAEAMAQGVAERCEATYGVALTGVAGPAEQDSYPPGTVFVAVYGPGVLVTRRFAFPGDRSAVREFAVTNALAMLRRALLEDADGRRR